MSAGDLFCECGRPGCFAPLPLTTDELFELRRDYPPADGYAVVLGGHEGHDAVVRLGGDPDGAYWIVVRAAPAPLDFARVLPTKALRW